MKGFFLNACISDLEKEYAELSVEDLLSAVSAPPGGLYSPMVDYPDKTLRILIERAALLIGITPRKLSKLLGVFIFSELLAINPIWAVESKNTYEMLKSHDEYLNKVAEMAFPGFVAPSFNCHEVSADMLEVNYKSTFLLSDIAEGIIDVMAIHHKENIAVEVLEIASSDTCDRRFILRRNVKSPSVRKLANG